MSKKIIDLFSTLLHWVWYICNLTVRFIVSCVELTILSWHLQSRQLRLWSWAFICIVMCHTMCVSQIYDAVPSARMYSVLQLYRRLPIVHQRGPESAQRLILHALSCFPTIVSNSATANRVYRQWLNCSAMLKMHFLNASWLTLPTYYSSIYRTGLTLTAALGSAHTLYNTDN